MKTVFMCAIFALFLGACTTPPTEFETGAETEPPIGCVLYKNRGGDC